MQRGRRKDMSEKGEKGDKGEKQAKGAGGKHWPHGEPEVPDKLREIVRRDRRFAVEAYLFVFESLEFTIKRIGQQRHVSGQELLHGIRDLAVERFGPLAWTVFRGWGLSRTEDFGEIVFSLVESGLMGKTENDSKDDFRDVFDFEQALSRDVRVEVDWNQFQRTRPRIPAWPQKWQV